MSFLIASTYLMSSVDGIRVVEAQIAAPAELVRDAEVQADRLHVADVRKAVRLGRKPRGDLPAKAVGRDVLGDHFANEVTAGRTRSSLLDWTRRRAEFGWSAFL